MRYNPAVTVLHVKRAASRKSRRAQIAFHEAMLYFYRKHYAATTPPSLGWLVEIGIRLNLHWTQLRERFTPPVPAARPGPDSPTPITAMDARRFRTFFSISLAIMDAAMLTLAFGLGYRLRQAIPWPTPAIDIDAVSLLFQRRHYQHRGGVVLVLHAPAVPSGTGHCAGGRDLYVAGGVSIGTLLWVAMVALTLKNSVFEVNLSRMMIVYTWLCGMVLVGLGRLVFQQLRVAIQRRGAVTERVIVVGEGDLAELVIQKIRGSPFLGYELVGTVTRQAGDSSPVARLPQLGCAADLPNLIVKYAVDEVIIAVPDIPDEELVELISLGHHEGVSLKVFPGLFDIMATGVSIDDLGGLPLLNIRDVALRGWKLSFKRAMDVLGGAVILILLSPLMLLLAILIKLDSPGPVFFIQERMGLDAKSFPMIKFRSMRRDAEIERRRLDGERRPAQNPVGRLYPQILAGRVSAVHQRPVGRHEPGGAAPGTTGLCGSFPPADSPLHGTPSRKSRRHRLGPGERAARRHLHLRTHEI